MPVHWGLMMTFAGLRRVRLERNAAAIVSLAALGVIVFASVWGSIEITFVSGRIAAVWIANAVVAIWALRTSRSGLPAVLLVGFAANVAGDLVCGDRLMDAAVLSLCNSLEVLTVLLPLRRLGLDADFGRPKTLLPFYGLALGPAPALSGLLAGLYLYLASGTAVWTTAVSWYFGDALALAILVPPLATIRWQDFARMFARDEWLVSSLLVAAMAAAIALNAFAHGVPLTFLFFPAVLLMTFVRGFAGGLIGLVIVGSYLLLSVFLGHPAGALAGHTLREQVIVVQTFGAVISFTVMLTGAALAERRRLEREMAEAVGRAEESREEALVAKEAAERASRTKSMFLANMSHELRTPLNAVIGFSDVMRGEMFGPLGDARYSDYAQMIREAGGHLLDLINDILDMSKIEAGKFEIQRERFDAREIVGDCVAMMQDRAATASVALDIEAPSVPLWLTADRRALKQILLNLLSNAVKFTPAGGAVTACLSTASGGRAAAACVLAVRDTGVGIPAEALKRLGNPFVQLRNGADLTHQGTGLGLALVRALTEMHQGAMRIESEQGAGTTVTIEIPLGLSAAAAAA